MSRKLTKREKIEDDILDFLFEVVQKLEKQYHCEIEFNIEGISFKN